MPASIRATRLTPNLIVSSVEKSVEFYRDLLGFAVEQTVPPDGGGPLAFASLTNGPVRVFFNSTESAYAEHPAFAQQKIGGTLTQFLEVVDIKSAYESLKDRVKVVTPLHLQWYGVWEFNIADPDGYLITFAELDQKR